ncbi:MAG: hypothetical protein ACKVS8_07465 [Phycisphaerales bacterium]
MAAAQAIVWFALTYAAAGVLFALAFALRGAGSLNPTARGGSWGFRFLIIPGAAALWPWLAVKWLRTPGADRGTTHNGSAA